MNVSGTVQSTGIFNLVFTETDYDRLSVFEKQPVTFYQL